MLLQSSSDLFAQTFQGLWFQVALYAPKIITAALLLVIGWIVGTVLGSIVSQVLRSLQVDKALRNIGAEEVVERTGYRLNTGVFLGTLVRWFIIVGFLVIAVNVLGLGDVNVFLTQILEYLPRVFVAAVMLIAAAFIGDAAHKLVAGSARATGAHSSELIGSIAKWAVWVFALLAVCQQLLVAPEIVQALVWGMVAMLALAGGLAFGLGGRETAARILESMHSHMK